MRRRLSALVIGLLGAMLTIASAAAQQAEERAIAPPDDVWAVILWTLVAVVILFVITAVGYLYRRERGLEWAFQRPDPPHEDEHH